MEKISLSTRAEIFVVAGVLWREGRFLAVRRPEGFPRAGWWEFPGGKIEPGEEPEQALVRELEEELGVAAETLVFWRDVTHVYPEYVVHLRFFHVTSFSGEPEAREGQGMVWLAPGDSCDLQFLPADVELARDLLEGRARPE